MEFPQDQVKPYKASTEDKKTQVRKMFDFIAPTYDRLNHTPSLGIDRYWRRKAVSQLKACAPERILDLATGTGDFAVLLSGAFPQAKVVGADISEGMMEVAKEKVSRLGLQERVSFQIQDCNQMTLEDDSFSAITISFGVRNFETLDKAMGECHRVLRKGGRLVILELSEPEHFPVKQLYRLYTKSVMPLIGRLISHDDSAYTYLPSSIRACVQGQEMADIIQKAGFGKVTYKYLTLGICGLYVAEKQ